MAVKTAISTADEANQQGHSPYPGQNQKSEIMSGLHCNSRTNRRKSTLPALKRSVSDKQSQLGTCTFHYGYNLPGLVLCSRNGWYLAEWACLTFLRLSARRLEAMRADQIKAVAGIAIIKYALTQISATVILTPFGALMISVINEGQESQHIFQAVTYILIIPRDHKIWTKSLHKNARQF